jgi:SAM-dependent methyltransferase
MLEPVLQGVERVLEMGCGTGFRALYHAANHPGTQFTFIDNDPRAVAVVQERARILGLRNVAAKVQDMYDPALAKTRWHGIFAIDCISDPPEDCVVNNAFFEYAVFSQFCSLVDANKPHAFYATLMHDVGWMNMERVHELFQAYAEKGGLMHLESKRCGFRKNGVPHDNLVLIASP